MTHQIFHDLNARYTCKAYDASKKISVEDMEDHLKRHYVGQHRQLLRSHGNSLLLKAMK